MKKWFASKEFKHIAGIITILCVVLLFQIFGFMHFNDKLYDLSLDHSMDQVEELSAYVEKNLRLELERYVNLLQVVELQMEEEKSMFSLGMIGQLQRIYPASKARMMGISDLDGNGVNMEGNRYRIIYEDMREHIERGEVYISNALKGQDETLIFIAVPLWVEGQVHGTLWAKYPLADIVDAIDLTDDMYKYFQIVDDKGNYIYFSNNRYSMNPGPQGTKQTIWEELEGYQYMNGVSAEQIHSMVENGESGHFYFSSEGQGRYVSFRPLYINNWYLFSVQADEGLHGYVNRTRQLFVRFFIILAIGLIIIFGSIYMLIYDMYKRIVKQHRQSQAINAMFRVTLQQTKNIPFTIDHKLKQVILYGYPTKDATQCCAFAEMQPKNMLKKGLVEESSLEAYQKLYDCLIVEGKNCDPVILHAMLGGKQEWVRVSITSDTQNSTGHMIGVLENYAEHKEKDRQIENQRDDIRKIEKKSKIDFLTNLYNREGFLEIVHTALEESEKNHQMGALLLLDLDHFKEVNDCMGHGMGDIVLQQAAATLLNFFRKGDIVGRLGGDEFVVFAQNIRNLPAFEKRVEELNHLLCKTYQKDGKSVRVSASIGIKLTDREHVTFQALYEKADYAMYQAKEAGRNGYQIYYKIKKLGFPHPIW